MTATPILGIDYIAEGDAQPWLAHNAALDVIEARLAGGESPVTGFGAFLRLRVAEVELAALSGASVTAAGLVPDRAIILGVASWVPAAGPAITGATGYKVGLSAGASEFGAGLGIAAGSSNIGVVGPFATYAPGDVVVTAEGGSFTGGTLRLAIGWLELGAGA